MGRKGLPDLIQKPEIALPLFTGFPGFRRLEC